eukprot:Seg1075.7 transcript_id=Seg1075.7/GoldUCD/mRNA.D3Y31 product="Phosphatidylglycerol/phosphatidylinositol transfer protein" protein_id=Seg1075.7/GoldUCD/D3Y31
MQQFIGKTMVTKRKMYYFLGFCIFMTLFFVIRSKYFERSDFLRPVSVSGTRTIKHSKEETSASSHSQEEIREDESSSTGGIVGSFLAGVKGLLQQSDTKKIPKLSPWDRWMKENSQFQSIGDIYDKCDNKTRKKIGKVVLEQDTEKGVKLLMVLNMTFNRRVEAGKAHMIVTYRGLEMHNDEYDLCEEAADLEKPLYCPFKKGYELKLRNYIKLPSYIPKGHYIVFSRVTDQLGEEFACINAEVLTGAEKS